VLAAAQALYRPFWCGFRGYIMATQILNAQVNKELEQYENDLSWVLENYSTLIEKYANKFVAVFNKRVIAHAETIQELMEELNAKFKAASNKAVIEFVYPEHPNFVLNHVRNMQA
jgi:hypothetical protein